jgi:hypothetical protein
LTGLGELSLVIRNSKGKLPKEMTRN